MAAVLLLAVFLTAGHSSPSKNAYAVGSPGPGSTAPTFALAATSGGTFSLAEARGKTVLLYFQEGIDCEPCWTQLKVIQDDMAKFHGLGIDKVVSITTDPLSALRQKAADEGVTIPVLSDPNLTVSRAYNANQYGMMGSTMDGHSFVVVGPTGTIEWRADYGGSPNYTMFVPDATLIKQMRAGMARQSGM
ncbi:MAG: peroxiredoxin family protein [Acidimicrobiales bacterium]